MSLASLDGRIAPAGETVVPATDAGLLRGDGVFEALRLYRGRPYALDDHLERLARSGGNLRLDVELDRVRAEVAALLAVAGPVDAVLRIVLTRGGRRLLLVEELPALPASLRLASVAYAPTRLLDGIKSLSYAANMLATRVAQERGADEALLVTPHGRVLEGPTAAFFWVRDGAVLTPPLDDHILDSITRRRVLELTGAREVSVAADELAGAEEAFLASSIREVMPVAAIDRRELGAVPGPATAHAAHGLRKRIAAELEA